MPVSKAYFPLLVLAMAATLAAAAFAAEPEPAGQRATRPNVLFIAVDDMNTALGCFGNPQVQSPNIDRLAREGTLFARAYCQYPHCNASRASVLTGRRPDTTRVFDLEYHFRQELPDVVTLPQFFVQQGYYVARVGKIFHFGNPGDIGTNGLDDRVSWMERYNPAGRDKTALEAEIINLTPQSGLGASMSFYADPVGADETHTDGKVADQTIELLRAHRNGPFFIAAGFYKPHCPWVAPRAYFDRYDLAEITVPEVSLATRDNYPAAALASTRPWPYFGLDSAQLSEAKRAYFAAISFVDAQVGRILDEVDRLGLSDNTIVVFWSDHGYHLGEHGLWFKLTCFEESARVPLIIRAPGQAPDQPTCYRVVELLDLYPTVVDLAHLPMPAGLEGVSLKPLVEDPAAVWGRPAFTQVERRDRSGHGVRTERWRYTEWSLGAAGSELYDHENDPAELHNLATDSAYAEIVAEMKTLLRACHPLVVTGGEADPDTRARYSN